jgi:inhibitor of KinA sporulation pathway (predicted exonuclease)
LFPNKEYDEEHRGLSDAIDEAKIIKLVYDKGWFKK